MSQTREPLGIVKLEALHYYVRDLERTRRFFVEQLDFVELGHSSPEMDREGRQHAAAFQAGDAVFVIHQPQGEGGRAWRYLRKHPEGVGTLVFQVEDIDRTFRLLDQRGGTFITDVQRFADDGGTLAMFSITTPFGDTTFRFTERRGYRSLFPGMIPATPHPALPAGNRFGFTHVDHVTSNFQTMKPALLWMEQVLGLEQLWEIAFHTNDVTAATAQAHGSGLKSVVMWDPTSGVKFANNEPFRPFFLEIIQRKGDNGFGAGNFRALFESIERQQKQARP